ncbi:hypothetical protein BH11ACT3_BH11ACT3_20890 [soil metagenome]
MTTDSPTLAFTSYGSQDPAAEVVLAIHGITSNGRAFPFVGDLLPSFRVIAPDLRGRGRSADLPGPFGLRRHAEDLAALLDAEGVSSAIVAGHSMGAFVAVELAALRPDLVERLVLVDGGLPLDLPPGATIADLAKLLGPAADRLSMEFATPEAYVDLWRAHPALVDDFTSEVEAYARYDLAGSAPQLRSSALAAAMLEDGAQLYGPDWYLEHLRGLRAPTTVLRAPRGLLNTDPLYPAGALESFADLVPQLQVVEVADVNHYTIVMSERGAVAVAAVVNKGASL